MKWIETPVRETLLENGELAEDSDGSDSYLEYKKRHLKDESECSSSHR